MRLIAVLLVLFCPALWAWGGELSPDEEIRFMPQPALLSETGLDLRIEAFVYEYERRPGLHTAFAHYLGVDVEQLSVAQAALFRRRTQLFRIDAERGKQPTIQFADGQILQLSATDPNGRSSTRHALRMPINGIDAGWLDFSVQLPRADGRVFGGRVQVLTPAGWSVVSDIDDTIKHSNVRDRRELLLNTFVRPFVAVPGLAGWYRRLAAQGAAFHYVSASPVQLDPPISQFLRERAFPAGSLHLRTLDLTQAIFADEPGSRTHKLEQIGALLEQFAGRQFVLVGDSGEADPEIYAELLTRYPGQVRLLLIRDVSGEPRSAPRYERLLSAQLADRLQIFTDVRQLPPQLPGMKSAQQGSD